jgi:hypothetical protein
MMGSEGPAVQADRTWYSERRVVRPTAIVDGVDHDRDRIESAFVGSYPGSRMVRL